MTKAKQSQRGPDIQRLAQLSQTLIRRIRGQDDVLERLVEEVVRRELRVIPPTGCRGAFIFAGPTGVGKTETAKLLARELFGESAFIQFDCSEFKTVAAVANLLGDSHGGPGRFAKAHAEVPAGVWLFDELEKADAALVDLFLQMTYEGRITLVDGTSLDLSRIYLVVTSNLGSAEIIGLEHTAMSTIEGHVLKRIKEHLRPELLGRFKHPFVFRPLSREVQEEITETHLRDLMAWQREHGRQVTYDSTIVRFLVQNGFSPELGARPLLDKIHELVGNAVANDLLKGGNGSGRLGIDGRHLRLVP
ncbi:MAG: ATP-dependent Clp protease ATP-binding subunit [Verrucomicrobiales bacterium]|nr:ATP-dependent Clp protease ATP-binding subunit [Verrucomicrobiales bacterium]